MTDQNTSEITDVKVTRKFKSTTFFNIVNTILYCKLLCLFLLLQQKTDPKESCK